VDGGRWAAARVVGGADADFTAADAGGTPAVPGGTIQLLHTRLSIIDLSEAGAQPMRDPATGNGITFNGEIYNFRSLRDELTEPDEPWQSHSDTEVILRAWRRWGLDCLTRLRGMYAFALWDAASRKLFLGRDAAARSGVNAERRARNAEWKRWRRFAPR
jgi:asparagine synthase (glutamine-hydrolysing)